MVDEFRRGWREDRTTIVISVVVVIMTTKDYSNATDGTKIISVDPWLEPFADGLRSRYGVYKKWAEQIRENEGGLAKFAKGYEHLGIHVDPHSQDVVYREYAPGVTAASVIGDFNNWNRDSNPMTRNQYGVWEARIRAHDGQCSIQHGSKIKISMVTPSGERIERLPAWIK